MQSEEKTDPVTASRQVMSDSTFGLVPFARLQTNEIFLAALENVAADATPEHFSHTMYCRLLAAADTDSTMWFLDDNLRTAVKLLFPYICRHRDLGEFAATALVNRLTVSIQSLVAAAPPLATRHVRNTMDNATWERWANVLQCGFREVSWLLQQPHWKGKPAVLQTAVTAATQLWRAAVMSCSSNCSSSSPSDAGSGALDICVAQLVDIEAAFLREVTVSLRLRSLLDNAPKAWVQVLHDRVNLCSTDCVLLLTPLAVFFLDSKHQKLTFRSRIPRTQKLLAVLRKFAVLETVNVLEAPRTTTSAQATTVESPQYACPPTQLPATKRQRVA